MPEIFLMEDSRPLRRVLTAQLRDAGFNVTSFGDGVASSDSELIANADVLITDIAMPIVGGEKAIENVQRRFPDLPIIVITGNFLSEFDDLDVFGKLQKPFHNYELIELVWKALKSQNPRESLDRKLPRSKRQAAS